MKFSEVSKNPVFVFLVRLLLLYIAWYFIYDLWLHPYTGVDLFVVKYTINASKFILELLGYSVFGENRLIGIAGTEGLMVGDPCDGMALFATFFRFYNRFPRGQFRKKLLFIPLRDNHQYFLKHYKSGCPGHYRNVFL